MQLEKRRQIVAVRTANEIKNLSIEYGGKVVVIPGFMNKAGVQSVRLGPRSLVRRITRKLQEV